MAETWVPLLVLGLRTALFHGAIRTAHAVRAIDAVGRGRSTFRPSGGLPRMSRDIRRVAAGHRVTGSAAASAGDFQQFTVAEDGLNVEPQIG